MIWSLTNPYSKGIAGKPIAKPATWPVYLFKVPVRIHHFRVGEFAGADSFDRTINAYINLGNDSSVNFGADDFSVEAWFNTDHSLWQYAISKGASTGEDGKVT